ncbi:MAG: MaoC family dehydratase N-terminal domain-containing protein, partial [Gemmatimonadales bacterium]|nr:MaoC family dehydratase N-terminal domain-containing protein [Gemmatimonadales bacterium]
RGGFMPPVPLPNRMWAGGDVRFEGPIPLGATMDKRSTIKSVEHKSGRSGDLVFVTVEHEISVDGSRRLHELQNIVYKSPAPAGNARPPADGGPAPGQHVRKLTPDTTMLFRYSALTFNGHRIHYDQDYCRDVEGYDNCVIHGPLVATQLCGLAADVGLAPLRRFSYRGLRPAILGVDLEFNATVEGNSARLWSRLPDGGISMQAEAEYGD